MFDGNEKDVYPFCYVCNDTQVSFVIYLFSSVYTMHDVYDSNTAYLPVYICIQKVEQPMSIARSLELGRS